MNWWKSYETDPLWGSIPRYRFPLLAWLLREADYRFRFVPRMWLSFWWGRICR